MFPSEQEAAGRCFSTDEDLQEAMETAVLRLERFCGIISPLCPQSVYLCAVFQTPEGRFSSFAILTFNGETFGICLMFLHSRT